MVQEIKTHAEFSELIGSEKPTVIDFHAVWCGPCKQIAPTVQKLADNNPEVNFAKVDVDELGSVSQEVGVRAMPTFMLFHKGEKVGEVVGANPAALATLVKQAKTACLAGVPMTPLGKAPPNPTTDFINNYGRFIVILIGLLIWYFKKDATAGAQPEDFPVDL